ncbi:MAG TPA: phosphoribosylformylglycinamidine cyclo-ligase [Longimicrobiales bacterium]|nr:phosphoribosylformylglycinamidine cyclo-ligase [Longimicrobiales bacterium]
MSERISYRDAGVDRDAADRAKQRIAALVDATASEAVLSRVGAFGGLFRAPTGMKDGVLVASADGVGTKLKVAMRTGRHDTVGEDLVNHCVDDILVEGARPLFFLDYIGMGHLEEGTVEAVVSGVARGCRNNDTALLGGETAEMPDFYAPGEYDLAGFIVGAVENDQRPGKHRVRVGDALIGVASGGFHTNGYTLLRRVLFDRLGLGPDDPFPGVDASLADVLLRVHRSYRASVGPRIDDRSVQALAHITGGGIPGNLSRVLPDGVEARVERASWQVPAEFRAIMQQGVDEAEMYRTFNMGVGMVLLTRPEDADAVVERLQADGEVAWVLGTVANGDGGVVLV